MKLPQADYAFVDQIKIVDYLLSATHADGHAKARFFTELGFHPDLWRQFADAAVGTSNEISTSVESMHGIRYVLDEILDTPSTRSPRIRTVWILEPTNAGPRLATAYPLEMKA
jgi:hypothetical protein